MIFVGSILFFLCVFILPVQTLTRFCRASSMGLFFYFLIKWLFLNSLQLGYFALFCSSDVYSQPFTFCFGYDSLSLFLILLTTFIFAVCSFLLDQSIGVRVRIYCFLFFILELLIILAFLSLDIVLFYFFFEISLIPLFLLIGLGSDRSRRFLAGNYLFLYTLFGSFFFLSGLLLIYIVFGTTNVLILDFTTVTPDLQYILWPLFFLSFAIKIPMMPFHLWLPEAHVEAPTGVSVVLAAIVLKLGGYGILRFLLPFFPLGTYYFQPLVITLALISALYACFTALRQLDMKRVIAYSSIAHMNFGLVGLFLDSFEGTLGFYLLMLGHGLVSAALFFIVGVLYDRYHTRNLLYYSGLTIRLPLFSLFFCFFTLANVSFPGTVNFLGELLVIFSIVKNDGLLILFVFLIIFSSTIYAFWLYNRVCFGTLRQEFTTYYLDLTKVEFFVFSLLAFLTIILGLFPMVLGEFLSDSLLVFFVS